MNSIKERVTSLNDNIATVLTDINSALEEKSCNSCAKLSEVPERICSIQGDTSSCSAHSTLEIIEIKSINVGTTAKTPAVSTMTLIEVTDETIE